MYEMNIRNFHLKKCLYAEYQMKYTYKAIQELIISSYVVIFSSLSRPDRLWGTPILLSNGYRELSPRG
jgi:hypothetical protein